MVKYLSISSKFSALGDPKRLAIVEQLTKGRASVSDLAAPLDLSLPAITKHLRVLESSGWIQSTKEGRTRFCRLAPSALEQADRWIQERREIWNSRFEALDRHLENKRRKT